MYIFDNEKLGNKYESTAKDTTYHEIGNLHLAEFVQENNDAFHLDYLNQSNKEYSSFK